MRTIVQQLLRGKPVEMSEEAKKEAEKEKEKYLSLLPQFRALLSEKEFDALKKQMEDYARIDPVICEDYYAEGLRFGIILGMETAFPASKENSVLDRLFFAGLYSFENICLSGKRSVRLSRFQQYLLEYGRSKRSGRGIQQTRPCRGLRIYTRSRGVLIRRVSHRADIGVRGGVPFAAGKRVNILPAGAGA